jgi:DNA-binding transcriptional ArsR family regulator
VGHGVPDRRDPLSHVPGGRADLVFAALADPTRRRLLDELSVAGPRTATQLATGYPMAGLLAAERDGRDVRYRLVPDPLTDATAWLAEIGHRWDDRLAALGHHLDPGTTA